MHLYWEENGAVSVENFIGGNFVAVTDYIESFDPSTGESWAKIPDSSCVEVNDAVAAARNAFYKYIYSIYVKII